MIDSSFSDELVIIRESKKEKSNIKKTSKSSKVSVKVTKKTITDTKSVIEKVDNVSSIQQPKKKRLNKIEETSTNLTKHKKLEDTKADLKEDASTMNSKYVIKFKSGSYEKIFYKNDKDTVESIYKDIFGGDQTRKLLYEDMKLSRFFTVEEAGFFPGINYITAENDAQFEELSNINLTLKIGDNPENDLKISHSRFESVKNLFNHLKDQANNQYCLINNGEILKNEDVIDDCCDDGDCVDVVNINMVQKI